MCTILEELQFWERNLASLYAWTLEFYLDRAGHNAEYPIYEEKERILGIGDIKTFSFLSSRFKLAIIAIRFGFMLLSSRSGVSNYHGHIGP